MGYQMRTVQKINKTRSGAVKHLYLPLLPSRTPEINLHPEYAVVIGWIDYHTGRYEWKNEFVFTKRKYAEAMRDKWYRYMYAPDYDGLVINTVAIVKRFRR